MQMVSTRWLGNQRQRITTEADLKISFQQVWDDSLPSNTVLTDNGSAPHGVTRAIKANRKTVPPRYVTFEQNIWVLDGSGVVLPENGGLETGFISEALGDEEGEFDTPPEVTIGFASTNGLRLKNVVIEWDRAFGDYAVTFDVVGLLRGEEVFTQHVAFNTTPISSMTIAQKVCDTLVVRVQKWSLPYRRVRLDSLTVKHSLTYDKHLITKFEHYQEVDPLSASLPKSGARFSIDNTDDKLNPYNPDSDLYGQLMHTTDWAPIEVEYGFKFGNTTEMIRGGTYYLTSWKAPQNGLTAEFEVTDAIGRLQRSKYEEGTYHNAGVSLGTLARRVLTDTGIPYDLDPVLDDIITVAPLPVLSKAECLQIIANAGRCTLSCGRDRVISIKRFTPPSTVGFRQCGSFTSGSTFFLPLGVSPQTYPIDSMVSFKRPELRITKPITMADVTWYEYTVDEEETELYRISVNPGPSPIGWYRVRPTWDPATDITVTVTGDSGLDLAQTQIYARGADIWVTLGGDFEIVVTGKKLKITERVEAVGDDPSGERIPITNPLITNIDHAWDVGQWVLDYLQNRHIIEFDWRVDPRLDANDIISMVTKYGSSYVQMQEFRMEFNGVFRGKGEGRDIGALGNARF